MARSPCRITRYAIPVRLNDGPGALLYRNLTAHTSPDDHRPHAIRSGADLKSP
jgi:hypothetical protein